MNNKPTQPKDRLTAKFIIGLLLNLIFAPGGFLYLRNTPLLRRWLVISVLFVPLLALVFGFIFPIIGGPADLLLTIAIVLSWWIFIIRDTWRAAGQEGINDVFIYRNPWRYPVLVVLCLVFTIGAEFIKDWTKSSIVDANNIPTASPIPTLMLHDYVFIDKTIDYKDVKTGDVVTFTPPEEAGAFGKKYIKRILAGPGDTIEMFTEHMKFKGKKHTVLRFKVNGQVLPLKPVQKPGLHFDIRELDDKTPSFDNSYLFALEGTAPRKYLVIADSRADLLPSFDFESKHALKLKDNEFYVVGDFRDRSSDSRSWGPVPAKNIEGRLLYTYFSANWKSEECMRKSKPGKDCGPSLGRLLDADIRWDRLFRAPAELLPD